MYELDEVNYSDISLIGQMMMKKTLAHTSANMLRVTIKYKVIYDGGDRIHINDYNFFGILGLYDGPDSMFHVFNNGY